MNNALKVRVSLAVVVMALVVMALVCVLWLAPALHGAGWLGWAIAAVLLATAVALVALIPALRAEEQEATGFVPLNAGVPAGTPRHIIDLAERLRAELANTPYEIWVAPTGVQILWDSGSIKYNTPVGPHQLREVYRTTLIDRGGGRFLRTDQTGQTETSLREATWASSSGRSWSFERRVDIVPTPQGLQTPVDLTYSSATLNRAIKAALAVQGGRTLLDAGSRMGIIAIAMGLAVALLGVLVAIV